jgi:hypothetical protein
LATPGNNSGSHTNVRNLELPVNQLVGLAFFILGCGISASILNQVSAIAQTNLGDLYIGKYFW